MRFNLFFLFLFLSATSSFAQKQKFELKGTIDPKLVEGKKLYFSRVKMYGASKPEVMTVSVTGGKFLVKGEIEEPEQAVLSFNKEAKADSSALSFLIDKGTLSVAVSDKLPSAKVVGSKADLDFKAYLKKQSSDTNEFNEFYLQLMEQAKKGASRDSLQLVFQNAYEVYKKAIQHIRVDFIKTNPTAFISVLLLPEVAEYSQDYTMVDALFNQLSADVRKTPSAKIIQERFSKDRQLAVGSVAPEFSQADVDGKLVKLADFRGKYVLVDFWASWCGPCRQDNPNIVRVYNQYKEKNFTVLGVSLDRSEGKAAWLKAIKDDNLTWTQVSDLNFWKNEVAMLYNVTSIPQNFLLDPQGKIIAKNLRGEQLENALSEILK